MNRAKEIIACILGVTAVLAGFCLFLWGFFYCIVEYGEPIAKFIGANPMVILYVAILLAIYVGAVFFLTPFSPEDTSGDHWIMVKLYAFVIIPAAVAFYGAIGYAGYWAVTGLIEVAK